MLVHRQAVEFTVDDRSVVHQTFPITEPLPVKMEVITAMVSQDDDTRPKLDRSAAEQPAQNAWGISYHGGKVLGDGNDK